MTKKLLALLLVLVMVFALTACGGKAIKDLEDEDDVIGAVDKDDDKDDDKDESKTESKSESKTEEIKNDDDFVDDMGQGQSTGKTYNNAALGLTYEIPDGFTVLSRSEINDTFSNSVEVDELGTASAISQGKAYYDFVIKDSSGTSLTVAFMKYGATVTKKDVTDVVDSARTGLIDTFKGMGATINKSSNIEKKFGSATYAGVSIDLVYRGIKMQQAQLYTGAGEYFAFIVINVAGDTHTVDSLLANFSDL